MGLISSKVEREELRPGDHIYTWRSGYSYSHHGIYTGDGKVVHLTRGPGWVISSSSRSQPSNDRVVCSDIQDFFCDGQLYRFEYGVSKILFVIKRAGTCLPISSNPPEQVLHCASYLLENGVGKYHLLNNNCEDFAIYCKISFLEDGISGQVISAFRAEVGGNSEQAIFLTRVVTAIAIFPYRFLPVTLIGQVLMFCGFYYFLRLFQAASPRIENKEFYHLSDEHNVRENTNTNTMEKISTRSFLPRRVYISWSFSAIYLILALDKESKISEWFKTLCLCSELSSFILAHRLLYGFKLGDNSACTIYMLGYLYWRWTSESTLLRCTRLYGLYCFLCSSMPHGAISSKLNSYAPTATMVLELLYWNPMITILQWIKLVLLYLLLINHVLDLLSNHVSFRSANDYILMSIIACFLIQSVAIFLGLDYSSIFACFLIQSVAIVLGLRYGKDIYWSWKFRFL